MFALSTYISPCYGVCVCVYVLVLPLLRLKNKIFFQVLYNSIYLCFQAARSRLSGFVT